MSVYGEKFDRRVGAKECSAKVSGGSFDLSCNFVACLTPSGDVMR